MLTVIKMTKKQPRYLEIAIDIAARIARNDLKKGQRLSGRSILSSEYGVSPETIRRSVSLLEEKGVVEVANNYGVIVGSKSKAIKYLESFDSVQDVSQLKIQLATLMAKRAEIDVEINDVIDRIVDLSGRFTFSDPMKRFEFMVGDKSILANKSLKETSFYQLTQMTLVAIQNGKEMILSPGPDAIILPGSILSVVGHMRDVATAEKIING